MNQKARLWIVVMSACGVLGALAIGGFVRAYEVDPAAPGVTVSGRVTYVGTLPLAERLVVDRDKAF